jgi:oxygen-independent coproporphyrinogen-3 oxidase
MITPETFARYAAMRVPRYTSYPTAPHFSAAVDHTEYRAWLRRIPEGEPTSIYLHVPFCRAMCWYCGCHTSVVRRQAPVTRYVASLAREIELVSVELKARPLVHHVHWGGGSPTLLPPESIVQLTHQLRAAFQIDDSAEIAVEVDPRTLTGPVAEAFAASGVNRASVGVQSFDPAVQAAINRMQSFETTATAVELLRSNGVSAINFDLIYGLPLQTEASCKETARQALRLRPDRLAVFGYAHVPSFKPHQRKIDEAALPGLAERHDQFEAMAALFRAEGYVQVGLDHFALPGDPLAHAAEEGKLRRNFQGYTTDPCSTLIGFGASAIGQLPDGFVQNSARIPDYQQRINDGRLAVTRGCRVDEADRQRARIIEALMCSYQADVAGVGAPLERLEADGLIRRCGSRIEVVEEARLLVRVVASAFDAYLPNSAAAHVVAV